MSAPSSGWSFNQSPRPEEQPEVPEGRPRGIFEVRTVLHEHGTRESSMGEPRRYLAHSAGRALDFHAPNTAEGATFTVKYLFDLHPDWFAD